MSRPLHSPCSPQSCHFSVLTICFAHDSDMTIKTDAEVLCYQTKENSSLLYSTFLKLQHLETLILKMTLASKGSRAQSQDAQTKPPGAGGGFSTKLSAWAQRQPYRGRRNGKLWMGDRNVFPTLSNALRVFSNGDLIPITFSILFRQPPPYQLVISRCSEGCDAHK